MKGAACCHVVFFVLASSATAADPTSEWINAGQPTNGVKASGEWVFSCVSRPVDIDSLGFADVELAECKQEAIEALVTHYVGDTAPTADLPDALFEVVAPTICKWSIARVQAGGMSWIRSDRTGQTDTVVLAVPVSVCESLPRGSNWTLKAADVAASSTGWIAAAAILEAADATEKGQVAALVADRLAASVTRPDGNWPMGFVKLPEGLPFAAAQQLSLVELAAIAASRPGDSELWMFMAQRCDAMGMRRGAAIVRSQVDSMGWPSPAPLPARQSWALIPTRGLTPELVAVVRAGGGIACQASPPGISSRAAMQAYLSQPPVPSVAESKAREAATLPDADALNLLAALRLLDPSASEDTLGHALAFAWQAHALANDHPYARINVLRAMQRLSMKTDAVEFLRSVPPAEVGTWSHRELSKIMAWIGEQPEETTAAHD